MAFQLSLLRELTTDPRSVELREPSELLVA
jgi:hypothetical protein